MPYIKQEKLWWLIITWYHNLKDEEEVDEDNKHDTEEELVWI